MQTTRGTSLTDDAHASPTRGMVRPRVLALAAVAGVVVATDQVTKAVAVDRLTGRGPVELFDGFLTLRLVYNPGAAFGLAAGFTIVLSLLAMVVVVVILRYARRLTSLPWAVALGLLLAGAVGNLIDRMFRAPGPLKGHVVDFLDLPFTLVFNVADMAITFAGVLMVVLTFRGIPLDGPPADGLAADGLAAGRLSGDDPPADGRSTDGPSVDLPPADGPSVDRPRADGPAGPAPRE